MGPIGASPQAEGPSKTPDPAEGKALATANLPVMPKTWLWHSEDGNLTGEQIAAILKKNPDTVLVLSTERGLSFWWEV